MLCAVAVSIHSPNSPASSGRLYEGDATDCSLTAAKNLVREGYALERWRRGPDREKLNGAEALEECLSGEDRRELDETDDARRERFKLYRRYRQVAPIKCLGGDYGYFAIPCHTVACESGYSWRAANPRSSAVGPYQLLDIHGRPWPIRGFRDKVRHHEIAAGLSYPAAWDFGCA